MKKDEPASLRLVQVADLPILQTLSRQTFYETFADGNSAEDMEAFLSTAFNIEKLRKELDQAHSEFYFAELENKPVGFLKVNWADAQTELKDQNGLEIERIYVLQSHQGHRIGQMFMQKAHDIATAANRTFVWLGVWEKNTKAIAFYERNGFQAFDQHDFVVGTDVQTDIMMRLDLV